MPFLTKSRSDGTYIKNAEAFIRLMPHMMDTRTESVVYCPIELPVENVLRYMDIQRAKGIKLTLFNVILAAIARTAHEYKKINRFIAGRRLYQHNLFEIAYVVKRELSIEGEESLVKIVFPPDENLFDSAEKMNAKRREMKKGSKENVDKMIIAFSRMPRWVLRIVVSAVEGFDYFGMLPSSFTESLPFYSSVFASNLGSIGVDAPFHHLYELGTCSIFLALGKVFEKLVLDADGTAKNKQFVNIRVTVDERMCDGFYLARALDRFKELVLNPELLEVSYSEQKQIKAQQRGVLV